MLMKAPGTIVSPSASGRQSEEGVDEWSHRTASAEYDQKSEKEEHDDDGGQPELLALFHEKPQVLQKIHVCSFLCLSDVKRRISWKRIP